MKSSHWACISMPASRRCSAPLTFRLLLDLDSLTLSDSLMREQFPCRASTPMPLTSRRLCSLDVLTNDGYSMFPGRQSEEQ